MTFPSQGSATAEAVSNYAWNETAGRYIDLTTGRFVPFSDVRDALESVIDAAGENIHTLTQSLLDGQISLADWQLGMLEQIKIEHTAAAAAANGGWAQMSQADWGAAGRIIRDQYAFLDNFAQQIASGDQLLNGTALVRADLYASAARGTFEQMRRRYEKISNGMQEERRVLGEADHCPGCLDQASMGWQPIGTLDPIGAEECVTHCHCTFKFRKMGTDGEWIVSEGE